jgi:heme O synthase-like polyprenyltransferase
VPKLEGVKSSRQWVVYSAIRVGIFAVALVVLLVVGVTGWIAAIVATVIGLCVSYIFFRPQRDAVAKSIVDIRSTKDRDVDNDLENDLLDRLESDGGRKA